MFKGREQIRDAYRDEAVASGYIEARFREPLGALLHARQVRYLRDVLAEARPESVLELAPGPARLTADIARELPRRTVLLDASAQMLTAARRRLAGAAAAIRGDAFRLPFGQQFDLVYAFRLIRHFEAADRRALYREIARVLRPGGRLVFDAINASVYDRLPADNGSRRHYDAALGDDELRRELRDSGFDDVVLKPVQRRYVVLRRLQILIAPRSRLIARSAMEIVDRCGGEPLEWVVVCRRA